MEQRPHRMKHPKRLFGRLENVEKRPLFHDVHPISAPKHGFSEHLRPSEVVDFCGRELRILRRLRHPFIVTFYGASIDETQNVVLIVEDYLLLYMIYSISIYIEHIELI